MGVLAHAINREKITRVYAYVNDRKNQRGRNCISINTKRIHMETTTMTQALATNPEGYLLDYKQWTREWAIEVAKTYGLELTDKHWEVLNWLRQKQEEGVALSIRKVGNSGIADIKLFYQLFPGGPLKISSRIAGIPKPVSCI